MVLFDSGARRDAYFANSISGKNTGTSWGLVEEFIVEFEGACKDCDITRWGQFTDIKDIKEEMLTRLEVHFEKWLNPSSMRREPGIYGLHWREIPAHEEIYDVFDQNPCRCPLQCTHLRLRFIGRLQLCPRSSKKPNQEDHLPHNLKNLKNKTREEDLLCEVLKKISARPNVIFKPADLPDLQIAADSFEMLSQISVF